MNRANMMKLLQRLMAMAVLATFLASPMAAMAQAADPAAPATATEDDAYCTKNAQNQVDAENKETPGILSEIYIFIKDVVGVATQKLFSAFTSNDAYQNAVYWTMVLMVVFFGIGFTIGIVQVSFQQVLIRLIKMAIIFAVISPTGWTFFSDTVVKFFMDGTDELVKGVIEIGMGDGTLLPPDATPFYRLDKMANFMIQPDTLVTLLGTIFSGGPYSMMMGGLMVIATWGFVSMLINALQTYAVTFVGRSLLLGVAPIFIVFLLFDKTKQMFTSWLNALLSMSLQPILLFTFLSFFIVLIESSAKDMMSSELCWTEFSGVQGTTNKLSFWRFKDPGTGELMTSPMTWEGSLQCLIEGKGKDGAACQEFPINIIDILSFLILVYIAQRFGGKGGVIDRIANELSNTFISLDAGGKMDQFFKQASGSLTGKRN